MGFSWGRGRYTSLEILNSEDVGDDPDHRLQLGTGQVHVLRGDVKKVPILAECYGVRSVFSKTGTFFKPENQIKKKNDFCILKAI